MQSAKRKKTEAFPILTLQFELLCYILTFLDLRDIASVILVSKYFSHLPDIKPSYWESRALTFINQDRERYLPDSSEPNYKTLYINRFFLENKRLKKGMVDHLEKNNAEKTYELSSLSSILSFIGVNNAHLYKVFFKTVDMD